MKYNRAKEKYSIHRLDEEYETVYDYLYGWRSQYDNDADPTMYEVRWGLLLTLLAKLRLKEAHKALYNLYW